MQQPPRSQNSAQPSKLADPVPGDDAANAAAQFMAQQTPSQSEAEQAAAQFTQSEAPPQADQPTLGPGGASDPMALLGAAGRVLDAPGGVVRTGLAEVAGLATGKDVVNNEDLKNMAVGKAPSSAEYLRRLGVNEGGSVTVPVLGKVTTRGAAGLALDIATDPLTAISKLIKEAPYIGKLLNAPNKASEAVGEAVYKSAVKDIDKKLAAQGKGSVGDLLIEKGAPVGGTAKLAQHVDEMSNSMDKIRQGLYDKATEKGVLIDAAGPLKRSEAVIARLKRDPNMVTTADALQEMLDKYKASGKVPVDIVSEWKTNLYDSLPAEAFNGQGKLRGVSKQFKYALASDFRQAIVDAGNRGEKGLGDSIATVNDKWGTLLSAQKPVAKAVQATGGKIGHMIDGAVLAAGGVKAAIAKKGYDIATTPFMKTMVGKALMEAGKKGFAGDLARRGLISSQQPEVQAQPPITPMDQGE